MKSIKTILIYCCGIIPMLFITNGSVSSHISQENSDEVTEIPVGIRPHGFGPATQRTSLENHAPLSEVIEKQVGISTSGASSLSEHNTGPYLPLVHQVFKQGNYFVQYY